MSEIKVTVEQACKKWVRNWDNVPASIIEKLKAYDENVGFYDSDVFRLLTSPVIKCDYCDSIYEGNKTLSELKNDLEHCDNCEEDNSWREGEPETFPVGWGTLFALESCDQIWIKENLELVTKCGIYVFESEDYGILLGVDSSGHDFYDAYWIPLYKARGLQWHNCD